MNIYQLWCETNAKKMTLEDFKGETGEDFYEFDKKNHQLCNHEWRIYTSIGKKRIKKSEQIVCLLTRYIHKRDLGKRTSKLEEAIRFILEEIKKPK